MQCMYSRSYREQKEPSITDEQLQITKDTNTRRAEYQCQDEAGLMGVEEPGYVGLGGQNSTFEHMPT